jgi:hypothetical protein
MQAARLHAQHRFEQGFTLPQMLSEYRALRASVIRRWTAQLESADLRHLLGKNIANKARHQDVETFWGGDLVQPGAGAAA